MAADNTFYDITAMTYDRTFDLRADGVWYIFLLREVELHTFHLTIRSRVRFVFFFSQKTDCWSYSQTEYM